MAKKIKYLFCAIVVMLVSHAYINRSENIIRYKCSISGDFICFGNNSSYSYHWPVIKKDGGGCGVVLIRINRRMILFSLTDYNIGFYMDI